MTDLEMFRAWMAQAGVEGVEGQDDDGGTSFAFGPEVAHYNGTSPAKLDCYGTAWVSFDREGNLSGIGGEE